jgi:hypothetical protein
VLYRIESFVSGWETVKLKQTHTHKNTRCRNEVPPTEFKFILSFVKNLEVKMVNQQNTSGRWRKIYRISPTVRACRMMRKRGGGEI